MKLMLDIFCDLLFINIDDKIVD